MPRHEFLLFADYSQFYVEDDEAPLDEVNFAEAWTRETSEQQLAATARAIAVGTSRRAEVPVLVQIESSRPHDDPQAELVTEASFDARSGRLVVMGCTDGYKEASRVPVAPGRYHARIFYYDQEKISGDALEGDDRYRVVLWPDSEVIPARIVVDRRTLLPSQRAR